MDDTLDWEDITAPETDAEEWDEDFPDCIEHLPDTVAPVTVNVKRDGRGRWHRRLMFPSSCHQSVKRGSTRPSYFIAVRVQVSILEVGH